jgi:integrase
VGVNRRENSQYWYIQFQFQGRTYIRSSRTVEKRAAEQMEREWKRQLHAQAFLGKRERITIHKVIADFCKSRAGTPNHRNLAIHSRTLERCFRTSRYFDEVTTEDLERLKRDREMAGCQPSTIRHLLNFIRGAWKYAKRLGYQVSAFDFPAVKQGQHRLRYLTPQEEQRLLREIDPKRSIRYYPPYENRRPDIVQAMWDVHDLIILLLDTGARYSEIASLEWKQVNLDSHSIGLWRSKVQNESVLFMTDRAFDILNRRFSERDGSPYVFRNKKGGKRRYASIAIRKAFRRAGLGDCCIHTLRHTHASRLVQNGITIYEVKEVLGHSDIKTTMRYAHLEKHEVLSRARDVINRLNHEQDPPKE